MNMEHVATVQRFYDAVAAGDSDTIVALLDGVDWYEDPAMPFARADGRPYQGGGEIAANVLGPLTTEVPNLGLGELQLLDLGDMVAATGAYTGTVARNGRTVDLPYVHLWHFRGNRLIEFQQLTDGKAFAAALAASS